MSRKEAPTWEQLGFNSAEDLSEKIEWEGGFNEFYHTYGCSVREPHRGSKFDLAMKKYEAARRELIAMFTEDGVELEYRFD